MSILENILNELDEKYLLDHVTKKHDEARIQFRITSITVQDDIAFDSLISDYYNYHFTKCISNGGTLPRAESAGRAKDIIEKYYKRKGLDKLNAYSDGKSGENGGMRQILDIIMESMKEEAVERHMRDVIDKYIAPSSWEEQVEIIKEIINRIKDSPHLDRNNPERYAKNYEELIRFLVELYKMESRLFRRM